MVLDKRGLMRCRPENSILYPIALSRCYHQCDLLLGRALDLFSTDLYRYFDARSYSWTALDELLADPDTVEGIKLKAYAAM